jgi:hypothetical protein
MAVIVAFLLYSQLQLQYIYIVFYLDFTPIGAIEICIATPCWFCIYNNIFIIFQPCSVDVITTAKVFFFLNSMSWFHVFFIMTFLGFCFCALMLV